MRLRDGSQVLIRPVRPDDKPLFVAGFEQLSEESRYLRFMGHKKALSVRDLEFFTELDHAGPRGDRRARPVHRRGARRRRYVRLADEPQSAEAAVVVIDEWQGRGWASRCSSGSSSRAREHGIERFRASLFTENRAMLALFRRIGDVEVVDERGPARWRSTWRSRPPTAAR